MITHVPNIGATRSDIHIYIYIYIILYTLYIYITYILYIYVRSSLCSRFGSLDPRAKLWFSDASQPIPFQKFCTSFFTMFSYSQWPHNGLTNDKTVCFFQSFHLSDNPRRSDLCFHLRLVRPLRAGEEAKWKLRPRLWRRRNILATHPASVSWMWQIGYDWVMFLFEWFLHGISKLKESNVSKLENVFKDV